MALQPRSRSRGAGPAAESLSFSTAPPSQQPRPRRTLLSLLSQLISRRRMCAQYFPMVIRPAWPCERLFSSGRCCCCGCCCCTCVFHTLSLPSLFHQSLSLTLVFFLLPPRLFSWSFRQHATCGRLRAAVEVCLLCIFVRRTPKLPLWSATFETWRMRSRC